MGSALVGAEEDWLRGIGRLLGSMSCTAFLADNGPDAERAYIVTNGHCVQQWSALESAHQIVRDTPATDMTVSFNYFVGADAIEIAASRIVYSTMRGRDIAVLELEKGRSELSKLGIEPLPWASSQPTEGQTISVVGAPHIGSFEEARLRRAHCRARGQTTIMERNWLWHNALRNDCQDIVAGSSGSPVLNEHGEVFAVINTTTLGKDEDAACFLGAPCEIGQDDFQFSPETSYAMNAAAIAGCFDEDGVFSADAADCELPTRPALALSRLGALRAQPVDEDGMPRAWEVEALPSPLRFKTGAAAHVSCQAEEGYAGVEAAELSALSVSVEEGPQVLCLHEEGQPADQATIVLSYNDSRPPLRRPLLRTIVHEQGGMIEPIFSLPELADFAYAVGNEADTDCSDPGLEWSRYRRIPIRLAPEMFPGRLCLRATDIAGNQGKIHEYRFSPETE